MSFNLYKAFGVTFDLLGQQQLTAISDNCRNFFLKKKIPFNLLDLVSILPNLNAQTPPSNKPLEH